MAFTQTELNTLERAIATGALRVRFADGREVLYRSLAEMRHLRDQMKAEVGSTAAPRVFVAEHRR